MSLLLTASPKHCANKGLNIKHINKKLLYSLSTFFCSILSIIFLIWLILHPSKPHFYLKDTDVYQLSLVASPHLLNSTIEFTLLSKNPNTRVGIYYDRVRAYASYKGQQITGDSALPPFYQGHEDTNFLSASLYGNGMPVNPSFGYEVGRDQTSGKLVLALKLDGQLRWKVGMWVSGRYRFDVNCAAVVGAKPGDVLGPLSLVEGTQCSTSV